MIAAPDGRQILVVGLRRDGVDTLDLGPISGRPRTPLGVPVPTAARRVVEVGGPGVCRVPVWPPRRSVARDDPGPSDRRLPLGVLWPDLQRPVRKRQVVAVGAPMAWLARLQCALGRTVIVAAMGADAWSAVHLGSLRRAGCIDEASLAEVFERARDLA